VNRRRLQTLGVLLAATIAVAGCAAGKAFRQGDAAVHSGDLDQAVVYYRKAAQAAPDNANYKIALQRTLLAASRAHLDKARDFESKDQLEAAVGEYRLANEYDPSNRLAANKVTALERTVRERADAARPKPAIQAMRDRVRAAEPALINLTTPLPKIQFRDTSLRTILDTIANVAGINISYERTFQDRPTSVSLDGATLEQALNQIMLMNELSYKVISDRSIFVFPDNAQNHGKYDDQVVRTFYLSHADATEVNQLLSAIVRVPGIGVQPRIVGNKTNNTVTVAATASLVGVVEKIIQQVDKPRAEIVVDVEIMEVERTRAKQYGLELSDYAVGGILSPEVSPNGTTTTTTPTTGTPGTTTPPTTTTTPGTGTSTGPETVKSPPPFNLNTISQGFTTADFYLAVPTAIARALESDSHTKVIAKPNLRGAEGQKLSFAIGQQIPIVSTSYTPIATGGAGVNPLSSYQYKDVGVNIDMTPRVTLEGDIILDLTLEDDALGADKSVAGVTVPTFVQRKVTTRLRLRDGESNLLAGLLQTNDQTSVTGFPGAIHVPILSQLFSKNSTSNDQLEIVMMLTPHIIRSQEITEDDLKPVYIGSGQNIAVGGPPPLIVQPGAEQPAAAGQPAAAPAAAPAGTPAYGGTTTPGVTTPPGSTPVPGTVLAPTPPATAQPNVTITEPPATPPAPPPATPAGGTPPATPPATPATPPAAETTTSAGLGSAQVILTPPGTTFRVGGGPYTVPISVVNAVRLSGTTLTITYDPALLRVRSVQEGSFLRTGGVQVAFSQQVNNGRIEITISRGADATGANGTGLLAAIIFDAIAPGSATLTVSGTATGPGGTAMGLQFRPVTVTVQQ
jgi:type II secretory pathway component GspD/PulD (secretin)